MRLTKALALASLYGLGMQSKASLAWLQSLATKSRHFLTLVIQPVKNPSSILCSLYSIHLYASIYYIVYIPWECDNCIVYIHLYNRSCSQNRGGSIARLDYSLGVLHHRLSNCPPTSSPPCTTIRISLLRA